MAGYKRTAKVYVLEFEDPEYKGLEVRAKSLPTGEFLEISKMASRVEELKDGSGEVEALLTAFARALVSWNLEDDLGPVPADLDGIKAQDLDFVLELIMAWLSGIAGVSAPLGKESNAGGTTLLDSMPMDAS